MLPVMNKTLIAVALGIALVIGGIVLSKNAAMPGSNTVLTKAEPAKAA